MIQTYNSVAFAIVQQQEHLIGPLAWSEAKKVTGLEIKGESIEIRGDAKAVLEALVNQYSSLFGKASVEACKDAIRGMMH